MQETIYHVHTEMRQSSAVSDLGLHCLQRSYLWDTRHEWVPSYFINILAGAQQKLQDGMCSQAKAQISLHMNFVVKQLLCH